MELRRGLPLNGDGSYALICAEGTKTSKIKSPKPAYLYANLPDVPEEVAANRLKHATKTYRQHLQSLYAAWKRGWDKREALVTLTELDEWVLAKRRRREWGAFTVKWHRKLGRLYEIPREFYKEADALAMKRVTRMGERYGKVWAERGRDKDSSEQRYLIGLARNLAGSVPYEFQRPSRYAWEEPQEFTNALVTAWVELQYAKDIEELVREQE